jgi:hypothetical protein
MGLLPSICFHSLFSLLTHVVGVQRLSDLHLQLREAATAFGALSLHRQADDDGGLEHADILLLELCLNRLSLTADVLEAALSEQDLDLLLRRSLSGDLPFKVHLNEFHARR